MNCNIDLLKFVIDDIRAHETPCKFIDTVLASMEKLCPCVKLQINQDKTKEFIDMVNKCEYTKEQVKKHALQCNVISNDNEIKIMYKQYPLISVSKTETEKLEIKIIAANLHLYKTFVDETNFSEKKIFGIVSCAEMFVLKQDWVSQEELKYAFEIIPGEWGLRYGLTSYDMCLTCARTDKMWCRFCR